MEGSLKSCRSFTFTFSRTRLIQGSALSPFLFSLFILCKYISSENQVGMVVYGDNVYTNGIATPLPGLHFKPPVTLTLPVFSTLGLNVEVCRPRQEIIIHASYNPYALGVARQLASTCPGWVVRVLAP